VVTASIRIVVLAACASGCKLTLDNCADVTARAGETVSCVVPGYVDRGFDLRLPPSWTGSSPLPSDPRAARRRGQPWRGGRRACPDAGGKPGCLGNQAVARGYALLSPDGVGARPLRGVRTWNAGGGTNGFICAFAAVLHEGVVSLIDIDAGTLIRSTATGGSQTDAFVTDAGIVFLIGQTGGQWVSEPVVTLDGRTGVRPEHLRRQRLGTVQRARADPRHARHRRSGARIRRRRHHHAGHAPQRRSDDGGVARAQRCAATFVGAPLPDHDPNDSDLDAARVGQLRSHDETHSHRRRRYTWPSGDQFGAETFIGRVSKDFGSEVILVSSTHTHA
jgi:hypothetical protein